MLKFSFFNSKASTDQIEVGAPMLCSFGLTEIVAPAIAGLLTSVGVGTATAGGISSVLAPALVQAGVGAGVGALTGQPGQGAIMGALSGGLGPLSNAMGMGGGQAAGAGALNMASPAASGVAGQTMAGAPTAPPMSPSGLPTTGALNTAVGNPLAQAGAATSRGLGGPLAILAALAQNANRQPTTAATPPGFNDPFNPNSGQGTQRTPTANYTPNGPGGYYTYGSQAQPQFYQNNQVHLAHGGALSRAIDMDKSQRMAGGGVYATGGGDNLVRGDGDGTSDSVPAKLSDSEYVLTAADVSRIGQGSSEAGAKKLDEMRKHLAHDAGAKQFQPRVKSPLEYLNRAA